MIATSTLNTATLNIAVNHPTAEPDFLEMLPRIRRCAAFAFRHARRAVREELLAEVVASAYAAFRRLVERGKAALAHATVLAKFAIRQVRVGRRVGSKLSALDVLSRHAQWNKGFAVQSLGEGNRHSPWQELVMENSGASPAELAGLRIDFKEWLQRLDQFRRRVALRLVAGDTTKEAARYFQISASRISQLRQELRQNWNAFQGEPVETVLAGV
jgi:hypothetical protein